VAETGAPEGDGPELWLRARGRPPVRFGFIDSLRPDARDVVDALTAKGYEVAPLSGDRVGPVQAAAAEVGVADWRAQCSPADKTARLEALAAEGRRVLMVGDGLNDAPALAAAHVSLSPASASDISQTAADAVFQGRSLNGVVELLDTARRSETLVRQNFALAFAYNVVMAPLAMAGFVTPLIAAVAMSSSSLLVTGNAFRLQWRKRAASGLAAKNG